MIIVPALGSIGPSVKSLLLINRVGSCILTYFNVAFVFSDFCHWPIFEGRNVCDLVVEESLIASV